MQWIKHFFEVIYAPESYTQKELGAVVNIKQPAFNRWINTESGVGVSSCLGSTEGRKDLAKLADKLCAPESLFYTEDKEERTQEFIEEAMRLFKKIKETKSEDAGDYHSLLAISVKSGKSEHRFAGALLSRKDPRIVQVVEPRFFAGMTVEDTARVTAFASGRALVEASGGITMSNIAAVAGTGVDMISIGALTHSSRSLDMSLEIDL